MGTLSLRERKKRETRQRILDVSVELFQDQGFDQTSVDEIAARADISRGTCFNYFPNKESILREIATRELAHLQNRSLSIGSTQKQSPPAWAPG